MAITVSETPWVTVKRTDPGFVLEGSTTIATRAGIEFTDSCPRDVMNTVAWAMKNGWIELVAHVPKDDPTLMWDTLKNGN